MRKMKTVKMSKMIDLTRKRVFIENDHRLVWDADEQEEIEQDMGFNTNEAFPLFIGDAAENSDKVLQAIKECDDIFVDTSYVGDSADLFNKMMIACQGLNITGKRIFNFRPIQYLHSGILDRNLYYKIAKTNLFYYRNNYAPNKSFELSPICY